MFQYITKRVLNKFGYEIRRKSDFYDVWDYQISRQKLLQIYDIDLIFDIGANIGQYALELMHYGYKRNIVSFEPITFTYEQLSKAAEKFPLWKTHNAGLGDSDYKCLINVSADRGTADTSSIHRAKPILTEMIKNAGHTRQEKITIQKVDTVIKHYYPIGNKLFLKSDTQGYEKQVIDGALNSLDKIIGMELELSLVPLYEGELSFLDMLVFLSGIGYNLVSISPGLYNYYTGQIIQVNVIFFRAGLKPTKLLTPNAIKKIGYPKIYF